MSRVAKSPISLPAGVDIKVADQAMTVKGSKGSLNLKLNGLVNLVQEDGKLTVSPKTENKESWAMAGTFRALINNMVTGVSEGFERKFELVGVGYRAQAKGQSF